jgi:hypothetical protein
MENTFLQLVTIRLSLNLFIGCWGYTLDREDKSYLVEEAVLTVCIAVSRAEVVLKFNTGTESKSQKRQLM